jgi:hypothetical protein
MELITMDQYAVEVKKKQASSFDIPGAMILERAGMGRTGRLDS